MQQIVLVRDETKGGKQAMRKALLMVICFLVGFIAAQAIKFPQPQKQTVKAKVVRVIDGDTFEAQVENKGKVTVRVIGYDAPEPNQPFGETAKKFMKAFLEGREVLLEQDVQQTDKYGRMLAHVWVERVLVSEIALLSGLGLEMTVPPNVQYVDFLRQAQEYGRGIGLGIWAQTAPSPKQTVTPTTVTTVGYVGNARSMIFHRPDCQWAQLISPRNRVVLKSREEAIAKGFRPCKVCQP